MKNPNAEGTRKAALEAAKVWEHIIVRLKWRIHAHEKYIEKSDDTRDIVKLTVALEVIKNIDLPRARRKRLQAYLTAGVKEPPPER